MSKRRESSQPTSLPHALTFRVMRLVTPLPSRTNSLPFSIALTNPDPQTFEDHNLNTDTSIITQQVPVLEHAPTWESEGAPCGVGALTTLPSSLGSIYASETFRCFISVFNRYPKPIQNVTLSVCMLTVSQKRIQLIDTTDSPRSLIPRAAINNVIRVRLPEFGVHELICIANYRDPVSPTSQRPLKQVFRLNVLPSLEPTLTIRPLYGATDPFPIFPAPPKRTAPCVKYLVDLRVLNSLPVPIFQTKAEFVPQHPFKVRPLIRDDDDGKNSDDINVQTIKDGVLSARRASMGVGDAKHFMFHVYHYISTTSTTSNSMSALSVSNETDETVQLMTGDNIIKPGRSLQNISEERTIMGHVNVSWQSALGEVGFLNNVLTAYEPQLRRNEVEVFIYSVPENVETHHPFTVRCAARNNANTAKRLYLQVRRDLVGEIVPVGVSGVSLGEVQPGKTAKCAITMLPLIRGTHNISGVRVVDVDTNISYKAEPPSISVS